MVELRSFLYRFYMETYRFLCKTITYTGPLAPPLIKLAGKVQHRFAPNSLYALNPVLVGGLTIWHDVEAVTAHALGHSLAMEEYELDTVQALRRIARPGMTVLDVGANVGYFSLLSAQLVGPNGAVWSFEPVPRLRRILEKNVRDNGFEDRIKVVPQAVSDMPGMVQIHENVSISARSSLYQATAAPESIDVPKQLSSVAVECTTLDLWAEKNNWPTVDIIKMDIEGAETSALKAMVELSRRNPQLKVIVELNLTSLDAANTKPEQLLMTIRACGFDRVTAIEQNMQIPDSLSAVSNFIECLEQDRIKRGETEAITNLLCEKANGYR